jgi:hypothetical protein
VVVGVALAFNHAAERANAPHHRNRADHGSDNQPRIYADFWKRRDRWKYGRGGFTGDRIARHARPRRITRTNADA